MTDEFHHISVVIMPLKVKIWQITCPCLLASLIRPLKYLKKEGMDRDVDFLGLPISALYALEQELF